MVAIKPAPFTSPDAGQAGYSFGSLRLEPDGTLLRGITPIYLSPRELQALSLLLARAGQILTPLELKQALWGEVHVTADSVPKCVSSLRSKLAPDECIQTVYKRGYRFSGTVRPSGAAPAQAPLRLAIMPFSTGFNVAEHLGTAIAEETMTRLTGERMIPVGVLARDSVFTLARRGLTALQVGEALHADLVLAGTLRAQPTHLRLRAEMIRVADGTQIWVEDLLAPKDRAAGIESELVERLVFRLGMGGLSFSAAAAPASEEENDPNRRHAYELFLRGHFEWQSLQRPRIQDAMQHLFRAAELDPSLVAARVDLANACIIQTFFGFLSPAVAAEQVRSLAGGIPGQLDGAEALLPPLAWIRFHVDHDLRGALHAFAACAHLPHDPWITRVRVIFALSRHRFDEALGLLHAALLLDPFAPWLNARLAWAWHLAGESTRSVEQAERSIAISPEHEGSQLYSAIILAHNGQPDRAIELAEDLARRSPSFDIAAAVHGYALARAGREREARETLERLQWLSRERFVLRSFTPAVCVALGDMESAIAELRAAENDRCPWLFQMLADPRLQPLHGHPEFLRMRRTLADMESAAGNPAGEA